MPSLFSPTHALLSRFILRLSSVSFLFCFEYYSPVSSSVFASLLCSFCCLDWVNLCLIFTLPGVYFVSLSSVCQFVGSSPNVSSLSLFHFGFLSGSSFRQLDNLTLHPFMLPYVSLKSKFSSFFPSGTHGYLPGDELFLFHPHEKSIFFYSTCYLASLLIRILIALSASAYCLFIAPLSKSHWFSFCINALPFLVMETPATTILYIINVHFSRLGAATIT